MQIQRFLRLCQHKIPLSVHMVDIGLLGLKFMISKYNKPHVLFIRFNTCIFPPYFLPICSSFHLRGKKPLKWTPTKTISNNNYKALSCGTTHLCFHKMWQIQWSHTLCSQQIKSASGVVHSRVVLLMENSSHYAFLFTWLSHGLKNYTQNCDIMFSLLLSTSGNFFT